jgi:hypothetical protein
VGAPPAASLLVTALLDSAAARRSGRVTTLAPDGSAESTISYATLRARAHAAAKAFVHGLGVR